MTTPGVGSLIIPLESLLRPTFDVDWRPARCAAPGENPEDWFPFPTDGFVHAAAVCAHCPIRPDCEEFGENNRMSGVWGGVRLDRGVRLD